MTQRWSLRSAFGHVEVALVLVIVIVAAVVAVQVPSFLSTANLINLLLAMVTIGIVALGQGFVIMAGELDLSVAATIAFTAACAAALMRDGVPVWFAVIAAIAIGSLIGLVNAAIVLGTGVNSFIVTLGTLSVVQGLTLMVTGGLPIATPLALSDIGADTRVAGIPFPVIVFVVLAIIAQLVLVFTVFGRRVLAVGDNAEAARLAGLPVIGTKLAVFAIAGGLAGVAGILRAASLGTAESSAGTADLLPVIAAVVVGGASLVGGRGSMIGVFLGAVLLGMVQNAYIILKLSSWLQLATFGAVVVAAGVFDQARQGRIGWINTLRDRRALSRSSNAAAVSAGTSK
ncbi:ABC transporter permease [Streptomyces albipurpureus]|uniref:ABC transporter permease n=1 Tax=Streptomyces albipurpureus TaxID=2897419 RepID=A0ABT0UHM5_9ACTN|nr:ABC transporter permease [Streptomyces sp. CWNU-1]MCM2387605.1 ABC transporter permease [Streptomyces sp. CWNU-1]